MIKNRDIQTISNLAQENLGKVYELVDKVVDKFNINFPTQPISYNEIQNKFIAAITDTIGVVITPLLSSVDISINEQTQPKIQIKLDILGAYMDTRTRVSREFYGLLENFLWDLSDIRIDSENDVTENEKENTPEISQASDNTPIEEVEEIVG